MREIYKGGLTPQQKIVAVNNKFGNFGIKDQQGTTRMLYDTLPIPTSGAKNLRFFEDAASRTFPFTNLGSDGNKLGVGNTIVISSISFFVLQYDTVNLRFDTIATIQATSPALQSANVSFEIANNRVLKNLSLVELNAAFDKNEGATNDSTYEMETQIVIPPLLNFVCQLSAPQYTEGTNKYVRCVINGVGGIIAPRTTF
jgi:hypothetical protein